MSIVAIDTALSTRAHFLCQRLALALKGNAMKNSKKFMLGALLVVATSAWVAGPSLAGGKSTSPPAQVKKTYNSGQSTTGYTQANPCCNSTGHPTSGGGSSNKTFGPAGLKQYGK